MTNKEKNNLFLKLYNEQKNEQEIADIMQCSLSTIRNYTIKNNVKFKTTMMRNNSVSFYDAIPKDKQPLIKEFLGLFISMKKNRERNLNNKLSSQEAVSNLIDEYRFYLNGYYNKFEDKVG